MTNNLFYYGKVLVIQDSLMNETVRYANGLLRECDGGIFVDLIEKSPFVPFKFSASRFIAQVEIKEPNEYRIFDLALNPIEPQLKYLEVSQFKVEMNNDFKLFKSFIEKQQLEKELKTNMVKPSIKKI
jgi:hypothetical protein